MEELTIEQKAKRYDEAIKIAKSKKNDKDHVLYEEDIIEIFHELKKNTDEEMIQKLIAVCHLYYGTGEDAERDECLEWLEKQKIKPYSGVSFLYNNHTWGMCARDGGVDILCDSKLIKHIGEQKHTERKDFILASFGTDIKLENDTIIIPEGCVATIDGNKIHIKREGKSALEAMKEEKVDNANKVEPKFKVGDWITNGDYLWQVTAVETLDYILKSTDRNIVDDTISYVDEKFHLWTIEDAKDGDVLVTLSGIVFLFQEIAEGGTISFYTALSTSNFSSTTKIHIPDDNEQLGDQYVFPANKEQRDLLFEKILETGYEWDAKKKQLINI